MTEQARAAVRIPTERFIVTELVGYRINANGSGARWDGSPTTSFYVQDTVYLYEVLGVFHSVRPSFVEKQRERARKLAARLNEADQ
jgi:hypothetical protein